MGAEFHWWVKHAGWWAGGVHALLQCEHYFKMKKFGEVRWNVNGIYGPLESGARYLIRYGEIAATGNRGIVSVTKVTKDFVMTDFEGLGKDWDFDWVDVGGVPVDGSQLFISGTGPGDLTVFPIYRPVDNVPRGTN